MFGLIEKFGMDRDGTFTSVLVTDLSGNICAVLQLSRVYLQSWYA